MKTPGEEYEAPPPTDTSAALRGGVPPVPPRNGPPDAVATGSGEDGDESDIRSQTHKEALAAIEGLGYVVTKISVNK